MTELPTRLREHAIRLCIPGETQLAEMLLAAAMELERLQAMLREAEKDKSP